MAAVENMEEIGDAANTSSLIDNALNSSEARVPLLRSTALFLQTVDWRDRTLPKI